MRLTSYSILICILSILISCKNTDKKDSNYTIPTTSNTTKIDTVGAINADKDENKKEDIIIPTVDSSKKAIAVTRENNNNIETIEEQPVIFLQDSSKYHIFITLDDGPQNGTRNCRNILKEYNVPATFFMIGVHNEGKERKSLVDSIHNDPLFVIGNHSNTHAYYNKYGSFYSDPKGSLNDFLLAEKNLNIKNKIARLPGRNTWSINHIIKGETSPTSTVKELDSVGYSVYGWDAEWHFTNGSNPVQSADEMVKIVENTLKKGKTHYPNSIVILVHDRMFHKPEHAASFRKFIATLKQNNNYIFDTLNNYPL